MTIILEKGETFDIAEKSNQPAETGVYYIGLGWDVQRGKTYDLDLVIDVDGNGGQTQLDLVYYANRTAPGIQLSEDNRTGEGEGDDESAIIRIADLRPDADEINIAVAVFRGKDFTEVSNPHLVLRDGDNANAPEIARYAITDQAQAGDTVLHAATLHKGANGWQLEAKGNFIAAGTGTNAIGAVANL